MDKQAKMNKRSNSLMSLAGSVRGSLLDLRMRASTSLPRFSSLASLAAGRSSKARRKRNAKMAEGDRNDINKGDE